MSACFHCGEPVAQGGALYAIVGERTHPVCCIGCRAAVEWIGTLGLGDYYRLRKAAAPRASAAADYRAWDRDELQRLYVHQRADGSAEVCVLVEGLRCAACSWLIERALAPMDGVCDVGVNVIGRRVRIVWQPQRITLGGILGALAQLGFAPRPLDRDALDESAAREQRGALKRLAVAGLGMMQAMMFAIVLYAGALEGIDAPTRDFFRWIGLVVTIPVIFYAAQPFFAGARREWRARRPGMDTPVALAVALVFVASVYETVRGGAQVYFDSASMFVFLLLCGRYLEMRTRHRAADVVDALARLQPAVAQRRTADGSIESVGVHELSHGDRVVVAQGGIVPADGVLDSAACEVDESLLSGESRPLRRMRGASLIAGALVTAGPAEIRVERSGAQTVLAGIVRLVADAQRQRPQWARYGDRVAAYFVFGLLAAAAATAALWLAFDPPRAFASALAVLVVACPCAFALAVPAALARAHAVLAQCGVLVLKPNAVETLLRANHFVFDKTGTLTARELELSATTPLAGRSAADCLALAAQLEAGSAHLVALALRKAAGSTGATAVNVREIAGSGVEGEIGGARYRLGHARFALADSAIDTGGIFLTNQHGALARFQLQESLRADAATTLATLRARGAATEILSGDSQARVAAVAARLHVDDFSARVAPAAKLQRLQMLRAAGKTVAVVGDGVNDAPALAAADLAIAIGGGADLAQSAADLVLAGDRLGGLTDAIEIATTTRRVMQQNILWAVVYNALSVPLAAAGWVPPWLAAIGMSASSLAVVLNSLRIRAPRAATTAASAEPQEERAFHSAAAAI